MRTEMKGVTERGEGLPVSLVTDIDASEPIELIEAINQGGYDRTYVPLLEVVAWIKSNRPELLT